MVLDAKRAFFDFINEREQVRLRKEADLLALEKGEIPQGPPWTQDSILSEYKFTNVHRRNDRTSKGLRENFYAQHWSSDNAEILFNCAKFRYFGRLETCLSLGWTISDDLRDGRAFDQILSVVSDLRSKSVKVFTGAYVITNQGLRGAKEEVVCQFLRDLWQDAENLRELASSTRRWEHVVNRMMRIKGFGGTGFMSKEVLLDTMMTGFWGGARHEVMDGNFDTYPVDIGSWTPVGPGGLRGAARVSGDSSGKPCRPARAREVIEELTEAQSMYWSHSSRLYPTDVQFQLCEFDKYERVRLEQGRPRSKYQPRMS